MVERRSSWGLLENWWSLQTYSWLFQGGAGLPQYWWLWARSLIWGSSRTIAVHSGATRRSIGCIASKIKEQVGFGRRWPRPSWLAGRGWCLSYGLGSNLQARLGILAHSTWTNPLSRLDRSPRLGLLNFQGDQWFSDQKRFAGAWKAEWRTTLGNLEQSKGFSD